MPSKNILDSAKLSIDQAVEVVACNWTDGEADTNTLLDLVLGINQINLGFREDLQ